MFSSQLFFSACTMDFDKVKIGGYEKTQYQTFQASGKADIILQTIPASDDHDFDIRYPV